MIESEERITSTTIDAFESALASWNVIGRAMGSSAPSDRCPELEPSAVDLQDPLAVCQEALAGHQTIVSQLDQIAAQICALNRQAERLRSDGAAAARQLMTALRLAYAPKGADRPVPVNECQVQLNAQEARIEIPTDRSLGTGGSRYVGPAGEVWLGKGRYPKWLKSALAAGKTLADFEFTEAPDSSAAV